MKKIFLIALLFIIAVISNAVMDTSEHHKGGALCRLSEDAAVQNWLNCSGNSWLNKYRDREVAKGIKTFSAFGMQWPYPVQLTDAFHFFKMMMVFAICAILALALIDTYKITRSRQINFLIYFAGAGIVWCGIFNLFYNTLLK